MGRAPRVLSWQEALAEPAPPNPMAPLTPDNMALPDWGQATHALAGFYHRVLKAST